MKIDDKTVERIAELAKLEFDQEEKVAMRSDLNRILGFIEKLSELPTENVEPLIFMSEEVNVLREDEIKVDITQDEALKNAPVKDSDYFRVPKVLSK